MSGEAVPRGSSGSSGVAAVHAEELRGTRGTLILAAALALGAWLRFNGLHEPSYWLDEMLGDQLTRAAAQQPWWRWLIGLEREHGPLYYLTQLLLPGRLAAALFGVATIPLVWLLAKRVHSETAAGVGALLLAVSPLHVYYSREARPYALLMMLSAALLVSSRRYFPVVLVALVYTSAVAAPVVAAIAVALYLLDRKREALLAALALPLFALLYRGAPPTSPAATFPSLDADFFEALARAFTVSAINSEGGGRTMIALLVFAAIGTVMLFRRDRRVALAMLAATLLPLILPLVALGTLGHWFAVRYVCAAVIGFLVLAATGMAGFGLRWRTLIALLLAAITIYELLPTARRESREKLDWRAVARTIREHARPGDRIITAEPWSDVSLRYYLGDLPGVRIAPVTDPGTAEMVVKSAPATWFVSAGLAGHSPVRDLMCRYPLVLASPLENLRVHYAPSTRDLLRRATPAEQRAAAAAFSGTFEMDDETLLGEGWALLERDFRWAVAREATLTLPVPDQRDRTIRLRALPLPPQTMEVVLNGVSLARFEMTDGWRDYVVSAPKRVWRAGNNTLTFRFAHATVPSPNDPRTLAAALDSVSIGGPAKDRPPIPNFRLGAHLIWRDPESPARFPAHRLRREQIEPLLGRLGYDPSALWPLIAKNEMRLDDVIASLAYGSDCEDPRTFLMRAFAVLLERPPSAFEEEDLLGAMKAGWSRPRIAVRIARSEEFGKRMMLP